MMKMKYFQHAKNLRFLSMKKILLSIFLILFLSIFAYAEELKLPDNIQKIKDYNKDYTLDFIGKISLFVAFLAGILSFVSPCILPLLPAFFTYTFKERKKITKMTLFFSLGFSVVFVTLGLIASAIGLSIVSFQQNISIVVLVGGLFLIMFGVMSLFGKGFSGFIIKYKPKHDVIGMILFGMLFALGWTACLGPILAGILSIGMVYSNFFYAGLLLFFYSLGVAVPLFILSFFYDKYNLGESKFIKGKELTIFNRKIHSSNLISGILFIFLGLIFVIYKGTFLTNTIDPFKTKLYFYSLNDKLLVFGYANIVGVVVFIIFLFLLYWFIWRKRK